MKIIDAHIHFSRIQSFKHTADFISGVDYSSAGLEKEYAENGVIAGIAMGLREVESGGFPDGRAPNPMGLDLEDEIPGFVCTCPGINPVRLDSDNRKKELENIEKEISKPRVVGIKIYAGYYHYDLCHPVYTPVYRLAEEYGLPVAIHSGATYSPRGLLRLSHPLNVDELAVKFRNNVFVICHMGDPWIMDTAAVIYKNPNVYADISGLIVADPAGVEESAGNRLFMDHIARGLVYETNYDRFLFGTDWPLVRVKPYIDFVRRLIPEEHHEKVFYENALRVYSRLRNFVDCEKRM